MKALIKTISSLLGTGVVLTGCLAVLSGVQESAALNNQATAMLARMASPDLATRKAAFDDFGKTILEGQKPHGSSAGLATFLARHPDQADRVKVGLIKLLELDDDAFMDSRTPPGTYTDDDVEHWAAVIQTVSSLDDERAIPALVGAMTSSAMAVEGLLKYGQRALGPVLNQFSNPNPLVRASAVSTAVTILHAKNDAASRAQISSIIRAAITDPEFLVRSSALWAIEGLSDPEQFVPSLQQMAQSDPFIVPGQSDYPLRLRAKKMLEEIVNH